ncbi:Alpha/Beta hydrolase protein [Cercophora newfieldiana]|uniref:Alpha/Beta hydrolase protein n=1 Tax=Cercophora newfieldiana TaxID=92897 RepID=A0AA39Y200_9PEZI|nr:Alpha/Beta hydrolase protein [Cercophora newfieldiana]
MPTPPQSKEEILKTGIIDSQFEAAWNLHNTLKATLPSIQQGLHNWKDSTMATEHRLPLSTGFTSRLIIYHRKPDTHPHPPKRAPVIVLFHGGIHALGYPDVDVPMARSIAEAYNAVVVLPTTRKAPASPFPSMVHDAYAIVKAIAKELDAAPFPNAPNASYSSSSRFLPAYASHREGFIIGGYSSGANIADVTAHLARDEGLKPSLTGLFLSCGAFMDPIRGPPAPYDELYLSREQNKDAPIANAAFIRNDIAAGHKGLPRVYFQVCGLDSNRDDELIYERVLRGECGVETRVDLYSGFPHCWWYIYPSLDSAWKAE